ncbi:hypothetical protein D3C86_1313010 [compost metagenome]
MTAALAGGDGVDFVDDHRARGAEHLPTGVGTEQHVQRFRSRDQNVRRNLAHRRALFLWRIASAYGCGDLQFGQAHHAQLFGNAGERVLQVDANVVGQRLERRDVDDEGLVWQTLRVLQATMHQIIDNGEERGEGLARACGRSDQRRPPLADQRPRPGLGSGDRGECVVEPGADGGVEAVQGTVCGDGQVHGVIYAGEWRKLQVPLGLLIPLWRGSLLPFDCEAVASNLGPLRSPAGASSLATGAR